MNSPSSSHASRPEDGPALKRLLGRVRGERPGPTLIAIGGMHGNEPAGIGAVRRVLPALEPLASGMRGEFVALAGNLGALARNKRFLARDLNRQWTPERIAMLRAAGNLSARESEDREQLELLDALEEILLRSRGRVYLLDMHTTSAQGVPFSVAGSEARALDFALHFPSVILLGLQGVLGGVLTEYLASRHCVALAVEGGQHESATAVDCHEALLWMALAAVHMLPRSRVPALERYRGILEEARGSLPRVIEVLDRHAIAPEDQFRMEPGYANIQPVRRGALLARDRSGEIRSPGDRLIVMPLYQALGDDGFFLGRAKWWWRLRVKVALRILKGELLR